MILIFKTKKSTSVPEVNIYDDGISVILKVYDPGWK